MNPKYVLLTLAGTVLAVILLAVFLSKPAPANPAKDEFAKCITSKGFVMYGSATCSHCLKEKAAFGPAFQYVKYVECPANPALCSAKNIEGFPTWEDSVNQKLYPGEQGLIKLSQLSGCQLPQ